MIRRGALLWLMMAATGLWAAPAEPALDDAGHVLAAGDAWMAAANLKLSRLETTTGMSVRLRFQLKSPPEAEDQVPGAWMHALAGRLGVAERGVLAVYFADEEEWRIWFGDETAPRFVGRPGTAAELTKNKAIHEAKEAFLTSVTTAGDAALAARQKTAPAGWTPTPELRRQLRAEAMIDALAARFGSR